MAEGRTYIDNEGNERSAHTGRVVKPSGRSYGGDTGYYNPNAPRKKGQKSLGEIAAEAKRRREARRRADALARKKKEKDSSESE
jgi:hypothetical protein